MAKATTTEAKAPKANAKQPKRPLPVRTKDTKLSKAKMHGGVTVPSKYTPANVEKIVTYLYEVAYNDPDMLFITELFQNPAHRKWYARFYEWSKMYPDNPTITETTLANQTLFKNRIKKGSLKGQYHHGMAQFVLRADYGMRDGTENAKAPLPMAPEARDSDEAEIVPTNILDNFTDFVKEQTKSANRKK